MVATTPRVVAAIACLVAGSAAFAPSLTEKSLAVKPFTPFRNQAVGPLFAEGDGPKDGTTITSARKEIGYDASTSRFFETDIDAEDCIPDDEYCVVDKETGNLMRLTIEEKERIFMDALQSYYVSGRQLLNDVEFDILKEDLAWNGSDVINMNRKESKYLAAVTDYLKGKPSVSDEEFDQLKADLKEEKSKFASSKEPKCYIDSGVCTVVFKKDKFRNNLLYLPMGAFLSIFWLGFGFEVIEPIIRLNPLILAALGAPLIYNGAITITDKFIFTDNNIVYGPCPSCEIENRVYFGGILGVEGFDDVGSVKCAKCKNVISVQKNTLRASTLPKA